jgi:hypothetical protein
MAITNKLKFIYQEKATEESTTSSDWVLQGTLLDADKMVAGNEYVMLAWVNCKSPGNNSGGTKFAFQGGGGDLVGSENQRHDTNSSGQYVCHIGQFTAPSPTQSIGVYRKRIYNGGNAETTHYGQCFAIDLSYSGVSGGLVSGIDYCSSVDTTLRSTTTNNIIHTHDVKNTGGTTLVLAASKSSDATAPTTLGLLVDTALVATGARYAADIHDVKSIPFSIVQNMSSGTDIAFKNLDSETVNTRYSYVFSLNLDDAPAINATGRLTNWTDHTSSGSWGTKTIDGNNQESFVIAMGRQTEAGAESGRMASISLLNNTDGNYLLFKDRPAGNYNTLYYPITNVGVDNGQRETSVIVGVGTIGDSDEIEVTTL